jgi:hypothetical protein
MPFYHRRDGRLVTGEFLSEQFPPFARSSRRRAESMALPDECLTGGSRPSRGQRFSPVIKILLRPEDRIRKQSMIDCFATQRWLLEQFDLSTERFRVAPECNFREPPHRGELHYETLGWGIAGAEWRRAASKALDRLGLAPRCR